LRSHRCARVEQIIHQYTFDSLLGNLNERIGLLSISIFFCFKQTEDFAYGMRLYRGVGALFSHFSAAAAFFFKIKFLFRLLSPANYLYRPLETVKEIGTSSSTALSGRRKIRGDLIRRLIRASIRPGKTYGNADNMGKERGR
jgi:hypothetical protein